jgi:hypothetical protein
MSKRGAGGALYFVLLYFVLVVLTTSDKDKAPSTKY